MPPVDVDRSIALARELLHQTGALQVSILQDPGNDGGDPAAIRAVRLGGILVVDAEGEEHELPHSAASDVALPMLPEMKQLPVMDVDAVAGQVTGTIGGLHMLADAVAGIATLVGGRSVVAADYETTNPEIPLGLAARPGDPVVVLLGDDEFVLDSL
ncbi:MAG: hypothetical protein JHC84_04775 [Solirubrobacteraceae bacterium]|nr:hypothetical protein [Solirubrobacteraceae bacterium]